MNVAHKLALGFGIVLLLMLSTLAVDVVASEAARDELQRCRGTCFDAAVGEAALRVLMRQEEEAPEGSLFLMRPL